MNALLHHIGTNLFSNDAVAIEISPDSEIDFSRVCRTCLRETEDNSLENEALFIIRCNGKLVRLHEMFESATGLKISADDMLPRHICNSCLQSVKSSFNFICQSRRANQILESVLVSMKDDNHSHSDGTDNEKNQFKIELHEVENIEEEEEAEGVEEEQPEDEVLEEKILETQEEMQIEMTEEDKSDPDEEDGQREFINFDEYSVDEENFTPIEDILPPDDDDNDEVVLEIEPLVETSEQDENTERVVLRKSRTSDILCDFCDFIFPLQRDLIQHYRDKHPNEKPFKCEVCSVSFVHIQSMRRHKNTHAAHPKQKACPLCSRSFTRSDDLTRHIRTHTDERPYQCSVCQKAFKQHTELKDHMLSHDDRKMYKCEPCNKEWRSRNGWYLHMKAHQDGRNGRRKQRKKKFE